MSGRKKDKTVYTFNENDDPLINPPGTGDDWRGFRRSNEKTNHRHKAKCSFCGLIIPGRHESLVNHKLTGCTKKGDWPKDLRARLKRKVPETTTTSGPISKFVKVCEDRNANSVESSFFKALVSTSVPFSFVDNPSVKSFFNLVGVKIPNR